MMTRALGDDADPKMPQIRPAQDARSSVPVSLRPVAARPETSSKLGAAEFSIGPTIPRRLG
jgi:hypothetical protein